MCLMLVERIGKFFYPEVTNAHDVVHEPDIVGFEILFEPLHFENNVFGAATVVFLPPDGFGAPIAMEGTATSCHKIHAEIAMSIIPNLAILVTIDQIPSRKGQS